MKKKLMFIIPTLCGGGAEKTVANLSNYLIEDYDIELVIFEDTDIKYSYSGNLTILGKQHNNNFIKKVISTIKNIHKLKKIKIQKEIDYSISFLTIADFYNVFSKTKKSKTIISIRSTDSIWVQGKIMKILSHTTCKKCDHIVSISNQVKDDLIDNYRIKSDKITTIYNPSLKIEFGLSKMKLDNNFFEDFVAITVGRLIEQKGQWHLIRAFSYVVEKVPTAKLIILGQGPLNNFLQGLVDDYNLNENILLLGFVDNPYDYIKRADCFVFSSVCEGLGNAILEALACETPVISCDCVSGPREILAPNTDYKEKVKDKIDYAEYGILIPTCDGKMKNADEDLTKEEIIMAESILEMINNRERLEHYKKMSKKRNAYFNIENIKKEWGSLLENLK